MMRRTIGGLLAMALAVPPAVGADGEITICAAASLREALTEIATEHDAAYPGSNVTFHFGSSGQLVQQIVRGAPCDVLATADLDTMERAGREGAILPETRATWASNTLVLVAPAGSTSPTSIADLGREDLRYIALGTPESVPAGRYAKEALELAGQWQTLRSKLVYGENVRQVLDYVARAEVEAGFVYATDAALLKDRVRVVGVVETRTPIQYPIAVVKASGNSSHARRFVDWVRSNASRRVLARLGFTAPP